MTNMKKKVAVVIGRFAPVHKGHIEQVFARAAKYDKVIVLLGSSFKALDTKNPFLPDERKMMILNSLHDYSIDVSKFSFYPIRDYFDNYKWIKEVHKTINEAGVHSYSKILVGSQKDESSYYLKFFPEYKLDITIPDAPINATDIRKAMFENNIESVSHLLTPTTFAYLQNWMKNTQRERFLNLQEEYQHQQKSRKGIVSFTPDGHLLRDENSNIIVKPYNPIDICVDNIVLWRNKILLVRRRKRPGKGLWALPGGHLEANERIAEGAIRELKEETHITIFDKNNEEVKLNSTFLRDRRIFDDPNRSLNGRKITNVFYWGLWHSHEVSVRGDDDVDMAAWVDVDKIDNMCYDLFEDHYTIIKSMVYLKPNG